MEVLLTFSYMFLFFHLLCHLALGSSPQHGDHGASAPGSAETGQGRGQCESHGLCPGASTTALHH